MKRLVLAMAVIIVTAGAAPVPAEDLRRPPLDYGILKSELIVQGHIVGPDTVSVDRAFLGSAKLGDNVTVKGLSGLPSTAFDSIRAHYRAQYSLRSRRAAGKKLPELVGPDGDEYIEGPLSMRGHSVVLFLRKDPPSEDWRMYMGGSEVRWIAWGTVYGYDQPANPGPRVLIPDVETRTPEKLYRAIADGVKKKARFESAVLNAYPEEKIRGLLEFLQPDRPWEYFRDACRALADIGPAAGPVLRRLADAPGYEAWQRREFISRLGATKDASSVPFLLGVISQSEEVIKGFVGTPDNGKRPSEQYEAQYKWSSALFALSSFTDTRAAPALRRGLILGLKLPDGQATDVSLRGLGKNAELGNLRVIKEALDLLAKKPSVNPPNNAVLGEIIQSLSQHKFPETIPILAGLLANPDSQVRFDAHNGLVAIAGEDLGEMEGSWLEWFEKTKTSSKETTTSR